MGKKMKNAPVYYALAQVRFNAVLLLEQYLPAIQDSLRKHGFTDFQQMLITAVALPTGQAQMVPSMQPQARFEFKNETGTAGVILNQQQLTFHTTDYDTYEPFLEALLNSIEAVHAAAKLSFIDRIGIRFLDAVCPQGKEELSKYLVEPLLGIADKLKPRVLANAISETRTDFEKTSLVCRAAIVPDQGVERPIAFPAQLGPLTLEMAEKFKKVRGSYAILDNDCWFEAREKFDLKLVEKKLEYMHNEIRKSFDLMVTPYALSVWE